MESVGVRELKNKLSHYLDKVKHGRFISVTERGQAVAILIPAQCDPDTQKAMELAKKGIGSWAGGKPRGAPRPSIIEGKPVSQIVLEDRRWSSTLIPVLS